MIQFKCLGLLLLVMILLERVSAACKFSIIDGVCNVDEDCKLKISIN